MDIKLIAKALGCSNKPELDECSDWNIFGTKGHIYHDDVYWYIYTGGKWSEIKKQLKFMTLWQDGDSEGCFRSDKLPDKEQAETVRRIVGLGKRRVLSTANKQKAVERLQKFRFQSRSTEALT